MKKQLIQDMKFSNNRRRPSRRNDSYKEKTKVRSYIKRTIFNSS